MRVVYAFTDEVDVDEVVRPVQDGDRLFILMSAQVDRDLLARRLSVTVTRLAEREWVHVGAVAGVD